MEQLKFTIPEMLSLIGLTQCVYVLVYMAFRSGDWRRAVLPALYFLVLGSAFFLDFAQRFIGEIIDDYALWQWALWFMGPPLSVLLIIQIARITESPDWRQYGVLFLVPIAYSAAHFMASRGHGDIGEWLVITGLMAGGVCMLSIWLHRGLLSHVQAQKSAQDRYWLILMLIIMNVFFLGIMFLSLTAMLNGDDVHVIRTLLGLGFVYLAGTSLFRIYPQALILIEKKAKPTDISADDAELAKKIEDLLAFEKVYHEPSYSRTDLARELMAPENVVSRVINRHFGKSFPQLLNERRIEDAKRLLLQTDESIKVIAAEVGFNSIASFNRAFRDVIGQTPSDFRDQKA